MEDYGKIPPQATDIEEVLLGALLLDGSKFDSIKTILPAEAFYNNIHSLIYEAMREINKSGGKIDSLTLASRLKDKDQIDQVGGFTYISKLTSRVAGSSHVDFHVSIVYEKWVAREIIRLGSEMIEQGYKCDDALDVIQEIRNAMNVRILHFLGIRSTGISIIEAANKSIEDYYIREKNIRDGITQGIPTTLKRINKLTGGLQGQQLIIIAGRPGMGKTSVAISFMTTAAKFKKKCAFFSFEMTSERLMDKVICGIAGVSFSDYKTGKLVDEQKKKVEESVRIIEQMDVTFNEDMVSTVEQIHATCKTIQERKGLDVVFIDYLQLMKTTEKTGNREQEISTMSRKAKMLAVDLNVPVILLSQLNRSLESRADKRPMLSDLRESGAIEQDADIVMFVYRDCVYNEGARADKGEIIVSKHREGATGIAEFINNESLTWFTDFEENETIDYNEVDRPF